MTAARAARNSHETESAHARFGNQMSQLRQTRNRAEAVAGYRVYCLDGVNKVASGDWIEADDDEAAIEIATERHEGYDCEVWLGRRLVARLNLRREA
jgi:hypothetical protein